MTRFAAILLLLIQPIASWAQEITKLPDIEVVATTPLLGSGMDRTKVPATSQVLTSQDINRAGAPSLLGALDNMATGVSFGDAQGNQFQPNFVYRGFSASPLDGNAQGIAVYVNGVRFNQPFSDTVNWDLLPDIAIDQVNLQGSNPVFGLNALGGALSIQLKNGFTFQGGSAAAYGGSFGTYGGSFEYGVKSGNAAAYFATDLMHSDGWRQFNRSDVRQFYGDIGWRGSEAELHVNLILADNILNGPGTVPVGLLAIQRNAAFTSPNLTTNKYGRLSLSTTWDVTDAIAVQSVLYYGNFSQRISNGNTTIAQPCGGFLCDGSGNFLFARNGIVILDFLNGGPYSQLNNEAVDSNGFGAAAQVTHDGTIFGLHNKLVAGTSFDGGISLFTARTVIGGLNAARVFVGPGIVIDEPQDGIVPVRVQTDTAYYGIYLVDIVDLTDRLSLSLSGRLNLASVDLHDRNGFALNGNHDFSRVNPGIGLSYKILPNVSIYASYAEANRAPTPSELSCSSPQSPCTLANFFVGDPSLKQVVSHTIEVGVRGQWHQFDWNLSAFRTDNNDEILFVGSAVPGLDYFQNVSHTIRQGIEAGLTYKSPKLQAWLNYAFTDATFQTAMTLDSPLNPAADVNGQIHVLPGNRLPGIPRHRLKMGVTYAVTDAWTVGGTATFSSGAYLFGDEANLTLDTGAYVVLSANTTYQISDSIQIFAKAQNLLNTKYATYGTFSPAAAVPGLPPDNRSLSPAPPFNVMAGVRLVF